MPTTALSTPTKKRTTVVTIDLGALREPWMEWCRSQGAKPSDAFRAIVRRLIEGQKKPPEPELLRTAPPGESRLRRVWLALTPSEHRVVTARAAIDHMTVPKWLAGLLRSHLTREPQLGTHELEALIQSTTQLRYLGRNLNQVAKGLNVSPHERQIFKVELIERLEAAIHSHTEAVSRVISSNVERWRIVE